MRLITTILLWVLCLTVSVKSQAEDVVSALSEDLLAWKNPPIKLKISRIHFQLNTEDKKFADEFYNILTVENLRKVLSIPKEKWKSDTVIGKKISHLLGDGLFNLAKMQMGSSVRSETFINGKISRSDTYEINGLYSELFSNTRFIDKDNYFIIIDDETIKIRKYQNSPQSIGGLMVRCIEIAVSPKSNPHLKKTTSDNNLYIITNTTGTNKIVNKDQIYYSMKERKVIRVENNFSCDGYTSSSVIEVLSDKKISKINYPEIIRKYFQSYDKSKNKNEYAVSFEIYKYSTEVPDSVFDFNIKNYPGRKVIYEK